jgi:hypothetical protein
MGSVVAMRKSVGYTTATNDGLPEKTTHSRYALDLLGPSKFVS